MTLTGDFEPQNSIRDAAPWPFNELKKSLGITWNNLV